jgi:NAD(P)H-dependent FMN reductase
MATLLIIWHSLTGGTAMMVEAVMAGAEGEAETSLVVKRAASAGADDLLAADGYIFACPENLASMAGVMKDFFDRAYYPALDQIQGRPYATMICAGSDGAGAARQIARIATGWRLKPVIEPLIIITHAQAPADIFRPKTIAEADLARCSELGAMMATGLAMGIF